MSTIASDDLVLLQCFEAGQEPPDGFHHVDHIRVAWIYLRRHPLPEAVTKLCEGLKAFATAHGKPERYHETLTWAYALIIHDRMARAADGARTWDAFIDANRDLLTDGRSLLRQWYAPGTLDSPLAKRVFLWPDRALPAVETTVVSASA